MGVEENWNQNNDVAKEDRDYRLPPVHSGTDQSRREHVSGNTVRHANPKRGVVVGGPIAPRDRHRSQIVVEQRAGGNFLRGFWP